MEQTTTIERDSRVVPKPVVILIVIVLTLLLSADVLAQFVVPGHEASPVLDGALLTVIGGVVAASRGPTPNRPPDPPEPPAPDLGRHRAPGDDR